jgi:2-dehydropantoate 2-reductase
MTEVVQVARASGVRLEKVSGTLDLDWIALTDAERHVAGSPGLFAKHALLLAVGARFRRLRSSMLTAIERGRPPAVDFLNGEVSTRGEKFGIPTPINTAVREQVLEIARGKARPSIELSRAFYEKTRSLVTPEGLALRPPAPPADAPPADAPPADAPPADAPPAAGGTTSQMEPLPEALTLGSEGSQPAPPALPAPPSPTVIDEPDKGA